MYKRLYRDGTKYKCFLAKDLDEAYNLKFFGITMHRDELMERITKHNPDLKWKATETHRGLFTWDNKFICGIPHFSTIPQFSIMEYNFGKDRKVIYTNMYGEVTGSEIVNDDETEYKVLARGWMAILDIVEAKGFKVNRHGL